jgi:flagellin-specific chaperone FliS
MVEIVKEIETLAVKKDSEKLSKEYSKLNELYKTLEQEDKKKIYPLISNLVEFMKDTL